MCVSFFENQMKKFAQPGQNLGILTWQQIHKNLSCVDNVKNIVLLDTLLSSTHLSSLYNGLSITKCLSSSIVL